jgi:CRISPR-associated endonuclease/helicase Cas3
MNQTASFLGHYWGKARPAETGKHSWHPVAYHCLDVAAAGQAVLRARPILAKRISGLAGASPNVVHRRLLLALALHDLGKFADCFQYLVPKHWHGENSAVWEAKGVGPKTLKHGEAGYCLWQNGAAAAVAASLNWDPEAARAFEGWLLPMFGHHGRPIADCNDSSVFGIATEKSIRDASEYAAAVAKLLWDGKPAIVSAIPSNEDLGLASWLIAGLCVMADWIGSNQAWFGYQEPKFSLKDYWQKAQAVAKDAVEEAGLVSVPAVQAFGLSQALNLDASKTAAATPLQEWAAEITLPETGPCLAFLEDLTGSGKTEAALILAHRLMARGAAVGLYWALPTQATSNALYRRLNKSYRNLFSERGIPSLALAHSSTDLQEDYQKSIFREGLKAATAEPEVSFGHKEEETASALCAGWLASDRRRSLLADVGVGTVDQALLAALPVKFQSLRLAALADRVLVIDEAHSYDRFTTRLLQQTLAFQAALGGSAIVLSATLTTATKNELLTAFAQGAGWVRKGYGEKARSMTDAFPLASLMTAPAALGRCVPKEEHLSALRGTRRDLAVTRLNDANAAVASLIGHARAGRCAVWVRNTVQDAIDGAAALAAAAPDLVPWLFHARFTLADRAGIEKRVLDAFGKDSTPEDRAPGGIGRILVATQVIEQSLDLDFDAMVTDLAPIDLLIQRAGRLHRHERGTRSAPALEIVSPAPVDGAPANWFSAAFPRAAYVYPHPGHLWRTMKLLEEARALRLASGKPRELLHAVFDSSDYPAAFEKSAMQWEGSESAKRALAAARGLSIRDGYTDQQRGFYDEALSPTRLGDDTRVVRLAKWEGSKLTPWAEDENEHRAWRMSEIQLRAAKAEARGAYYTNIENAAREIESGWPGRAQTALLLPLRLANGVWSGTLAAKDGKPIPLVYSVEKGLQFS